MPAMKPDSIPSLDECRALIYRYSMRPNIIEHSMRVMDVSLAITDNLVPGTRIDRDLVAAASLLHDITKTRSLETKERHDVSGARLLRELGYLRVADIVEQHVFFRDFSPGGALEEREIVYYADKRVMHNAIVTVEERVADLVARYGTTPERTALIIKNKDFILALEKKICSFMAVDMEYSIDLLLKR